ncbi:hypothetical protein ACLI1A_00760 [Flavobacterium sp. RHBU_3]|uniref:hypothetical protein n=1 Tax=Flavobacterium sp. RHBU_3 TaxID=3391184 RepID=UPI003984F1F3
MKKSALLLLPIILLLTSCATVFNRKEYNIKLTSKQPNLKVKVNDSVYTLPAKVKVQRSKQDLPITVISDSVTKQAVVEYAMSPVFFYGNLGAFEFCPIPYGIDLLTQKRFYYGKKLVLDDTTSVYKPSVFNPYKKYFGKTFYGEKGQLNFIAGMPYGNLFYMQPRNIGPKTMGGFFGLMVGAEYYYTPRKFLQLTASISLDVFAPVPVGVDYFGDYERMRSRYFTLTNNYITKRMIFGYGINYSIYSWELVSPDYGEIPFAPAPSKKNSHAFGTSLSIHHQVANYFSVGVTYNPTFYSVFPKQEWLYQHTISFEAIFRLPANKKFKFRWK